MNGSPSPKRLLVLFLLFSHPVFGQYILNGSAQKVSCNCYTLTTENTFQSGSVWNGAKISLRNSFDFWFNVFLGCKDGDGADGIVFILQPNSTSVGTSGEGMGFGGVQPSIGIALDTWQNFNWNDPYYDHISIQANGDINHNNDLDGPVSAAVDGSNIEDCQWHKLRITWDATGKWLRAYFDDVLRVQKQIDLVTTIFNGDPAVYWGFTGATGGAVNVQQFCTALDPIFTTNLAGNGGCEGKPVNFTDASESFAPIIGYNWDFGDGTTSTLATPAPHTYPSPGNYPVKLKITGKDGCENDSTITVKIGSVPTAAFQVSDTCFGAPPRVQFQNNNVAVSYQWLLDGAAFSAEQQPVVNETTEGRHKLEVTVSSDYNCGPPATASAVFEIKPRPKIEAQVADGCTDVAIFFSGMQTDNKTTIIQWQWDLGDGSFAASKTITHQYSNANQYRTQLWAFASNGCSSDTVANTVIINAAIAKAGRDTAVIKDLPFQLNGSGNGDFSWSPAAGLSDAASANPVVTISANQQYVLTVTTAEGCVAKDTVFIKAFKGPAVYVPNAITPNSDGKNDVLRPVYVGIRELKQFTVYNRWGQLVFTTTDTQKAWAPKDVTPGTYVWLIQVVNNLDQPMTLKGTVTIIR